MTKGTAAGPTNVGQNPCVLIVGAGPTGLTLACELVRRGVPTRVIEASPGPQPGSRGKGIQPRTLEVLDNLGVAQRVLAHGRLAMPLLSTGPDGRVTHGGEVPAGLRDRPDIPYPASLITPEWRVEEALRARLSGLGGQVEFGTALTGFDKSAEGLSASLTRDGVAEIVAPRWLVGCDGGHSTVRKQAGIRFEGETRDDVRMIVADVAADGVSRDAWHMWRHAEGAVSLCPLPSTASFQYQASIAPGQDADLGLANLQAILERRTGRDDIHLGEPKWSTLWRANERLVESYRAGRVLLAGDAAHIHSPAGGQGMNTGIQDAVNLGWKLAAVANGADPGLLDSYEAERRPVAAHALGLSNARLRQALQYKGMTTRRDTTTIQLDVGYRGSALARDDRDEHAAVRAGDRAPDARGLETPDGEYRLFELLRGGSFTLLSFGRRITLDGARADLRVFRVVPRPAGPGDVADTAGQLARFYGARADTVVLIRPDGYVGMISDKADTGEIASYLAAVS